LIVWEVKVREGSDKAVAHTLEDEEGGLETLVGEVGEATVP
jgi:hypothetical protein